MVHTCVCPALLSHLQSSPGALTQTDVLTSGRGFVVTLLYLADDNLSPQMTTSETKLCSRVIVEQAADLQCPSELKIIVILLYQWSQRGKGCPYQQGVLVSDFWRILQLVLEILGKLMFEEAKEWDSLAAKERWEEKGSLTCTTGIHFIKVWTLQHFLHLTFEWSFFLTFWMFTGMKDKDFLRIFTRCLNTFSPHFF